MKALHHHCIIDIQIIISIIIDIQISRPVNPASKYNQCELADTQGGKYLMHWVLKYSNYWWGCGERRWRGVNPRKRVYSSRNSQIPPSLLARTKQTKMTLIVLGRERASAWKKHWRKQRMGNQVKVHLVAKVDHLVIISVVFITIVHHYRCNC